MMSTSVTTSKSILKQIKVILPTVITTAICIFQVNTAFAQEAAKLYSVEGLVEGRLAPDTKWQAVTANTVFKNGDAIRTGDSSRAAIVNADGMMVRLSSNALLEFQQSQQEKELALKSGDAYFLSRDPHNVPKVTTSIVSGSIRGTEFSVSVQPSDVKFSVINGSVDCSNKFGAVSLAGGEEAVTEPGKAPVKRIMVRPFDAVQWALRYPGLVSTSAYIPWIKTGTDLERKAASQIEQKDFSAAEINLNQKSSKSYLAKALIKISAKDSVAAYKLLNQADQNDAGVLLLKSSFALDVGQVESAKKFQERASELLKNDTTPAAASLKEILQAQQAVISIVQNDRENAEQAVTQVLAQNPKSIDGLFAQSLLLQSKGNIDESLKAVEQGLSLDPENSFLLARAAELKFGSGETANAEKLAMEALQQNPSDADAKTILGFILLGREEIEKARSTFEEVLATRGGAPAHLGLGITLFRLNEREQARVELQKAVHLDPQVSLYRSYLGKAFFENEQEGLASEELENAIKLDPLDPTPHLYQAFNQLATFKPVAALSSLEDSIALNNNRAVYRSRLLLDKDQATRGTGIGRIFSALDFIQPAQIEALKSLAEDPTNYESHFLLKDSLIGPEADAASITEDVVATLLAPATFSSLLPTASGAATLNNYTTLFERSQNRTVIDVLGQSKDELFETSEVYFAGGADYSYLLRHGMTYANGYRDNDYDRSQTGRFIGQYAVSPDDKMLLEGIVTDRDSGDTTIGLDPLSNDPDQSAEYDDFTGRLGYHHNWSENSHLIAQTLFINSRIQSFDLSQNRQFLLGVEDPNSAEPQIYNDAGIFDANSSVRTKGVRGDAQHLWNSEYVSLVSGASVVGFTDYQNAFATTNADDLGIFESLDLSSQAQNDVHAYRGYSYATFKPEPAIRVIGGLNYSNLASSERDFDPYVDGDSDQSKFSPKAGLIVYPDDAWTLRGAYFETLGETSSRDLEGLEPVQVAGIRQTFDDPVGTQSRVAAIGTDWKLPKSTYTGVTMMHRSLTTPESNAVDFISINLDNSLSDSVLQERFEGHSQEETITTYVNQILTDSLTSTLNYDWTKTDDDYSSFQIQTQRLRLGLNYFDDSGFFAFGSGTYRWQSRDNYDALDSSVNEDFFILSAGLGMQLPHRSGSIQLAVRNILDQGFNYVPVASDVRFYSGVDISLGISLNF